MIQISKKDSLEKNVCQCYEVNMPSRGSIQIHTEIDVDVEIEVEIEIEIESI